jgi:hypothetical protein
VESTKSSTGNNDMEQSRNKRSKDTEQRKGFEFMTERELLQSNIEALHETSEKLFLISLELEKLSKEYTHLKWDILYLEEKINHTAKSLGVDPLPKRASSAQPGSPNGNI